MVSHPPIRAWPILLAVSAAVVVVVVGVGLWLDRLEAVPQPLLFWSFALSGGAGVGIAAAWGLKRLTGRRRRVLFLIGVALAWRVAYFPILVFGGFVASLAEAVLLGLDHRATLVYPVFLLAIMALHAGLVWLVAGALGGHAAAGDGSGGGVGSGRRFRAWPVPRWVTAGMTGVMLIVASLVSFTSVGDLTVLPDRPWPRPLPVPAGALPRHNPYTPLLALERINTPQRVLLLNAGLTYDLVPHSPWAATVKGTLETMVNANPLAGSRDRIQEHYLAYIAAHAQIRANPAQMPWPLAQNATGLEKR